MLCFARHLGVAGLSPLQLQDSNSLSGPDQQQMDFTSSATAICAALPGLVSRQIQVCREHPNTIHSVSDGARKVTDAHNKLKRNNHKKNWTRSRRRRRKKNVKKIVLAALATLLRLLTWTLCLSLCCYGHFFLLGVQSGVDEGGGVVIIERNYYSLFTKWRQKVLDETIVLYLWAW